MAFAATRFIKNPPSAKTSTKSNIFLYNELSNNEKIKYTWNGASNRPSIIYNLYCSNRNLEKLPDNLPDTIEKIDCSFNQIKELPDKLPSNLKYLDCCGNELNKLPQNLVDTNIQELKIAFNKNLENIVLPKNIQLLHIDNYQFMKFFDFLSKLPSLYLEIYQLKNTISKFNIMEKMSLFSGKASHSFVSFSNNKIRQKLIENYKMLSVKRIEGGSKTVKNSKKSKKINMKKSELQKIALKNKVSLKKRDGTMKKKDELIKSLKLKKLL